MADKWIPKDLKEGELHHDLGVPQDHLIPEVKLEAAEKKPGKVGERARFAERAKGFKHGKTRTVSNEVKKVPFK